MRQQVAGTHTPETLRGGDDNPNPRVVVDQDLAVAPTRGQHAAAVVADRHDNLRVDGSGSAGRGQRNQLRAGSTSEVVEVHPEMNGAVLVEHHSSDGVHFSIAVLGDGPLSGRDQVAVSSAHPLHDAPD